VHGITGHRNEHFFYNGARHFSESGFDTYRFDLYSWEDKGRKLKDCSLKTHASDVDAVVDNFKDEYSQIFLVGQSLGGPAILWSSQNGVRSIVLWDPSYKLAEGFLSSVVLNKELNLYVTDFGADYLLSVEMVEDIKRLDERLLREFKKPTKIICAGDGILYKDWEKDLDKIDVEHEMVTIGGAGHCFDEEGVENELFKETLEWLDK